ncbi:MAG: histidinol-phosphate transaminase [Deltaproteobacteria bacterium]|nr:histidinol-phosphate transaminase [Deltaproteobacteria bacterium]
MAVSKEESLPKKFFRKELVDASLYRVEEHLGTKLDQNESPWDLPMDVKVAITEELLKRDWNRYPLAIMDQTKEALANDLAVRPSQVSIANGSNILIQALIMSVPVGAKVLIVDPTFSVYEACAKQLGRKIVKVPLSEAFELLTERMLKTIKKEKPSLIFIPNPNANTGSLFEKKSLYRIIQMAACPVVIDEAYFPFSDETVLGWLQDLHNMMVLRTYSKAYGLAGLRLGALIGHEDLVLQIEKQLMPFRMNIPSLVAMQHVLKHPDLVKERVDVLLKERARVFSALQKIEGIQVFPSEANFLLIRVQEPAALFDQLLQEKVIVRLVDDGEALKGCLRISIGTAEENDQFLAALKKTVG